MPTLKLTDYTPEQIHALEGDRLRWATLLALGHVAHNEPNLQRAAIYLQQAGAARWLNEAPDPVVSWSAVPAHLLELMHDQRPRIEATVSGWEIRHAGDDYHFAVAGRTIDEAAARAYCLLRLAEIGEVAPA